MAHRPRASLRRRLFAGVTILSLVLCLATVGLWVRSYWRYDTIRYVTAETHEAFGMKSTSGEFSLFAFHYPFREDGGLYTLPSHPSQMFKSTAKRFAGGRSYSLLGFGCWEHLSSGLLGAAANSMRALWFPHWFAALLFAMLPALRLRSILAARRRNRVGLCPQCGYDLRATPERCPECGAVPSVAKPAAVV